MTLTKSALLILPNDLLLLILMASITTGSVIVSPHPTIAAINIITNIYFTALILCLAVESAHRKLQGADTHSIPLPKMK